MLYFAHMKYENPELAGGVEDEKNQEVAEAVLVMERIRRLMEITRDPVVCKGAEAFLRTVVNAGISGADLGMGVGEVLSWSAHAAKLIAIKFEISLLNTTPDVPFWVNILSEAGEVPTLGTASTHSLASILQLIPDKKRMGTGVEKVKKIWRGRDQAVHTPEVAAALETFAK